MGTSVYSHYGEGRGYTAGEGCRGKRVGGRLKERLQSISILGGIAYCVNPDF
jgi:hypothetical protein